MLMRGEPLVAKLAGLAMYVVLPSAMVASLIYSPPEYAYKAAPKTSPKSS